MICIGTASKVIMGPEEGATVRVAERYASRSRRWVMRGHRSRYERASEARRGKDMESFPEPPGGTQTCWPRVDFGPPEL